MTTDRDVGTLSDDGPTWTARFERVLAHPPEAVWEALTSSQALERWLTTASISARAGGEASFDFGEGPACGRVTIWEPTRALGYEWPFPEDKPGHVSWTLEPIDEGRATRLVLEHTGLPPDWATGYGSGWHAYLDRLSSHLAGRDPQDWAQRVAELRGSYERS
jgi:uncharacterized protein YndB with AHSA1/START domain